MRATITTVLVFLYLVIGIVTFATAQLSSDVKVMISDFAISNTNESCIMIRTQEVLPVTVTFTAEIDSNNTRVKSWISGEADSAVSSQHFDVIAGHNYTTLLPLKLPTLEPRRDEVLNLHIRIESIEHGGEEYSLPIKIRRTGGHRVSAKLKNQRFC